MKYNKKEQRPNVGTRYLCLCSCGELFKGKVKTTPETERLRYYRREVGLAVTDEVYEKHHLHAYRVVEENGKMVTA